VGKEIASVNGGIPRAESYGFAQMVDRQAHDAISPGTAPIAHLGFA
jgi:hypothetical protein